MTSIIKIRPEIVERIKSDNRMKARLAYEFNVHAGTVVRWLDSGDITLTSAQALKAICEEFKLEQSDILTEAVA